MYSSLRQTVADDGRKAGKDESFKDSKKESRILTFKTSDRAFFFWKGKAVTGLK